MATRGFDWETEERVARKRAQILRRMQPQDVTVEVWLSAYRLLFPDKRTRKTRRDQAQMLKAFRRVHGPTKMRDITALEAQGWALSRPGEVRWLRHAWRKATLMGVVPLNIWLVVEMPERTTERRRPPTREELTAILAECARRGEWWIDFGLLIEFAAYTGAREGGVVRLVRSDVDLERRRVILHEKGGRTRTSVLTGRSLNAVAERLDRRARDGCACPVALVGGGRCSRCGGLRRVESGGRLRLWQTRTGGVLTEKYLQKRWAEVRGEFPHGFHSLRHFAATWLREQGVDPLDVAVQLGHTDAEGRPRARLVERVYDHPDPELALKRIERQVA